MKQQLLSARWHLVEYLNGFQSCVCVLPMEVSCVMLISELVRYAGGAFPYLVGRVEHGYNVRPDLCATENPFNPR